MRLQILYKQMVVIVITAIELTDLASMQGARQVLHRIRPNHLRRLGKQPNQTYWALNRATRTWLFCLSRHAERYPLVLLTGPTQKIRLNNCTHVSVNKL